jgi:hypothetical protein
MKINRLKILICNYTDLHVVENFSKYKAIFSSVG